MKKIENKFITKEILEESIARGDNKIGEYVNRMARGALGTNQILELHSRVQLREFLEAQLEAVSKDVPKPAKKKAEPKDDE